MYYGPCLGVMVPQKGEESERKGPVRYGNKRKPKTQQNKENPVEGETTPIESTMMCSEV